LKEEYGAGSCSDVVLVSDDEEGGGKLGGFVGERREAGLVGSRNGNML